MLKIILGFCKCVHDKVAWSTHLKLDGKVLLGGEGFRLILIFHFLNKRLNV